MNATPHISVIVPTFFRDPHAPHLQKGLHRFCEQFASQREDDFEIFLSDSGPSTAQGIIKEKIEHCLETHGWLRNKLRYHYECTAGPPLSRAAAMNLGTQHTQGEILLFLHIDCRLPDGGLASLRQAFERKAKGGGFLKKYTELEGISPLMLTEQYLNWLRTWLGHHLVGTNGIFLHRDLALEHPYQGDFLEDVELSDWLRRRLKGPAWQLIRAPIEVSTRKYHKLGVWPSLAINLSVMALYRIFDLPPTPLKEKLYHRAFPQGWQFWTQWSTTVIELIRHQRKEDPVIDEERS